MKLTPVLIVENIEPSLPFWVDRLGFQLAASVPEGDSIGFAMLVGEGAELMFQTVASVRKDEPKFVPENLVPNTAIFLEMEDFAVALKKLEGYPIAMPERTTFYGMREIGVRAPSGHTVILAARA